LAGSDIETASARLLAQKGAQILAVQASVPGPDWAERTQRMAVEAACWVLASCFTPREGAGARLIAPSGRLVAEAKGRDAWAKDFVDPLAVIEERKKRQAGAPQ
jgi:predicted amidohydrolase